MSDKKSLAQPLLKSDLGHNRRSSYDSANSSGGSPDFLNFSSSSYELHDVQSRIVLDIVSDRTSVDVSTMKKEEVMNWLNRFCHEVWIEKEWADNIAQITRMPSAAGIALIIIMSIAGIILDGEKLSNSGTAFFIFKAVSHTAVCSFGVALLYHLYRWSPSFQRHSPSLYLFFLCFTCFNALFTAESIGGVLFGVPGNQDTNLTILILVLLMNAGVVLMKLPKPQQLFMNVFVFLSFTIIKVSLGVSTSLLGLMGEIGALFVLATCMFFVGNAIERDARLHFLQLRTVERANKDLQQALSAAFNTAGRQKPVSPLARTLHSLQLLENSLRATGRTKEVEVLEEVGSFLTSSDDLNSVDVMDMSRDNDIRQWLVSVVQSSDGGGDKLRSKGRLYQHASLKNAAGSPVSSRQVQYSLPPSLSPDKVGVDMLKALGSWNFDMLSFAAHVGGHPVPHIAMELLSRQNILGRLSIPVEKMMRLFEAVEKNYRDNSYHNSTHAADVLQGTHVLCSLTNLYSYLSPLQTLAVFFAAVCHDVDHPGNNNNFEIMSNSPVALIYNDKSVLENHHSSVAFSLLLESGCDILSDLSQEDYRIFRAFVVDAILATDLAQNFQHVSRLQAITSNGNVWDIAQDPMNAAKLFIKGSDIGHATKEWALHEQWCSKITQEFFLQGDREAELKIKVSPFMTRDTNIPKSQCGFMEFIVCPLWEVLAKAFPETKEVYDGARKNWDRWKELCSKEGKP